MIRMAFKSTLTVFLLASVTLQGCSWLGIRDNASDYRQAEATPRIQLPEGYDNAAINDAYPIPEQVAPGDLEGEFEVPRADVVSKVNTNNVRAFRSQGRYWIVANDSPGSVWARTRRFWEVNGIALEAQDPNSGRLETAWLSRKSDEQITANKFRLQIAPGMREDSAEIELQHIGFPGDAALPETEQLDWNAANRNDELALSIMKEIAAFLIETEYEAGSVSLLAQNLLGAPKTSLEQGPAGEPVLEMRLNFQRAWEAVQNGLAGAEIEVEDKNRSEGLYYLKLKDENAEEESSGWFSFFGKDKEAPSIQVTLQLKDLGDKVEVRVQGDAATDVAFASELLTQLRNNLL